MNSPQTDTNSGRHRHAASLYGREEMETIAQRHAACLYGRKEMQIIVRRKLRAAVHAVMVAQRFEAILQQRRLENDPKQDPMYAYQYAYEEPEFEWEDTTVPVVDARRRYEREASLTVEDVFASDDHYLRKLAKRRFGPEKVRWKRYFQDTVLALLSMTELSRTMNENMHPRNRRRVLDHVVSAQPTVRQVLRSQENFHKVHLQLEMRQKLRAAVYVVMAVQLLEKRAKVARDIQGLKRRIKVKQNLQWLSSHSLRLFPLHPQSMAPPKEGHEMVNATDREEDSSISSGAESPLITKLAWPFTISSKE